MFEISWPQLAVKEYRVDLKARQHQKDGQLLKKTKSLNDNMRIKQLFCKTR